MRDRIGNALIRLGRAVRRTMVAPRAATQSDCAIRHTLSMGEHIISARDLEGFARKTRRAKDGEAGR